MKPPFIVSALLALLCGAAPIHAGEPIPFRIAIIHERAGKPSYTFDLYTPLLEALKGRLAPQGIAPELTPVNDRKELAALVSEGRAEAVMESLFTLLAMPAGALERWIVLERKGRRDLRSVIFVRRESAIHALNDLKGKSIAFESPRSTSAYALPKAVLRRSGLELVPDGEPHQGDAVRYLFAGDERSQAYWVSLGKTDAGAVNDDDLEKLPEPLKGGLRVLAKSPPTLRWLLDIRSGVPTAVRRTVGDALMEMAAETAGRDSLAHAKITGVTYFTPEDEQTVREIHDLLRYLD